MRVHLIVIFGQRQQYVTKMSFVEDDDMIHAFPAGRTDQPFGKAILSRRSRRGGLVSDAHGAQSACDDGAIDAIPIADEVGWRLTPRKGLR